jgi:TPR repeat protein
MWTCAVIRSWCRSMSGSMWSAVLFLLLVMRPYPADAAPDAVDPAELQAAQKLCERGDAESCYGLGVLHFAGNGVPKDLAQAARLLGRACEGGFGNACYLLGQMHVMGEGVPKDRNRGLTLISLACSLGEPKGCQVVDQMRKLMGPEAGGTDQGREAAVVSIERRCAGKVAGTANATDKEANDCKRVCESFRKGCQSGNPNSCEALRRVEAAMRGPAK